MIYKITSTKVCSCGREHTDTYVEGTSNAHGLWFNCECGSTGLVPVGGYRNA